MSIIPKSIDYLNSVAKTNYSADFKPTIDALTKLINAGYGYSDFKLVIDKKANEWKGTKFQEYIRPSTLFGQKFENYLNEQPRTTKNAITKLASAVNQAKRTDWKLAR
jgi:uncharacterized phage protein (TIGR02220 family)